MTAPTDEPRPAAWDFEPLELPADAGAWNDGAWNDGARTDGAWNDGGTDPTAPIAGDPASVNSSRDPSFTNAVSASAGGARAKRGAPLPVAAAVAALWAALFGFAPILLLTAVSTIGTGAAALSVARFGTGIWLVSQGVPLAVGADRISLAPLALTGWIIWRLARAGVHVARATGANRARSLWPSLRSGLAVGVAYGLLGAVISGLASTEDVVLSSWRAFGSLGAFAAAAATLGALRHGRAGRRLAGRMPRVIVDGVRAGMAATAFLIAAGAAAGGLALALSGGAATDMLTSMRAGLSGQIGLTAICLAYLPNLAIWGAAYLLGPGFALGVGTVVSPGDVLLGPVPAMPVLAALPAGPLSGAGPALLGVPLLAGLAAGVLIARRDPSRRGWGELLGAAALAGPIAGAVIFVVGRVSSGALGSGRLAEIGVVDWRVPLFGAGVIAVGAVFGAAARTVNRRP